jgi:hypothetical protein
MKSNLSTRQESIRSSSRRGNRGRQTLLRPWHIYSTKSRSPRPVFMVPQVWIELIVQGMTVRVTHIDHIENKSDFCPGEILSNHEPSGQNPRDIALTQHVGYYASLWRAALGKVLDHLRQRGSGSSLRARRQRVGLPALIRAVACYVPCNGLRYINPQETSPGWNVYAPPEPDL